MQGRMQNSVDLPDKSTLSTLMSTTVDILCFYFHPYNQLFKVKYAFNLETFLYVGT